MIKATYKKFTLNFKNPSGTSRGILRTKETWFLILEENGKKALSDSIISKKSIYLGKKSYIDYLEGETKEGEKVCGYHIRMKGTPNQSIMYECRERNINPFEFYDLLYNKDDENKNSPKMKRI